MAAALAATSLVFEGENDKLYAKKLVEHARQLYSFGNIYRGLYNNALKRASEFYE